MPDTRNLAADDRHSLVHADGDETDCGEDQRDGCDRQYPGGNQYPSGREAVGLQSALGQPHIEEVPRGPGRCLPTDLTEQYFDSLMVPLRDLLNLDPARRSFPHDRISPDTPPRSAEATSAESEPDDQPAADEPFDPRSV